MAEKLKEQAQQTKIDYDLRNVKDYSAAMADYLEKEGTSTEDDYYKALVKARNEKMANGSYSNIVSTAYLELLFRKYEKAKSKGISNELTEYVESVSEGNNVYWDPEKVKKFLGYSQISAFKTGGYTGEWGSSGRFAVLHEKELVLNATDTSNLLKAAEIIRQVSEIIDLEAVSNQFILNSSRNLPYDSFGKSELEQRVTIEANFPGV
jgi:hypothetical protein